MRRRAFVGSLLCAAAFPAIGQRVRLRVGIIGSEPWPPIEGLREGLKKLGFAEGQNLTFDYQWFRGEAKHLPEIATNLVRQQPDVIVTVGTPAVLAAKRATGTIPIVMGLIGDPVGAGVVSSIARPGGNVTGVSVLAAELEPKRLEILKEITPALTRVVVLGNATNQYTTIAMKHAQSHAAALGLALDLVAVKGPAGVDDAFREIAEKKPGAVLVVADQFLLGQRERIAAFLTRSRLPSAFTYREHVDAGGLLSYSTNYHEAFRKAAVFIDRIAKGARPGDLPIEQVDRFELVLNLKAAKALGIAVPASLRVRVDQVVE